MKIEIRNENNKENKDKNSRIKIENVIKNEKATTCLILFISKHFSNIVKELKKTKALLALKKSVKPLVPGRVRTHERQKSVSLAPKESEAIKPFALYSIKKDRLATNATSTKTNNTPRDANNINLRVATEENKSNTKLTESVFFLE